MHLGRKYWHQNVLKAPKVKVVIMKNVPHFQMHKNLFDFRIAEMSIGLKWLMYVLQYNNQYLQCSN